MKIIMNLNGTVLCPFQGMLDLTEQIGDNETTLTELLFKPVCELNIISDWVYVDDFFGDLGAIRAHQIATIITNSLNKKGITSLELHVQLDNSTLTNDNFLGMLCLSELLSKLSIFFYVAPNKISDLQKLTLMLHEKNNIAINYRQSGTFLNDPSNHKKAMQLEDKRHKFLCLKQFSFYNDLNSSVSNIGSIIGYAWSCLKSGAYELGCQVLQAFLGLQNLEASSREEFFVNLQVIRFLSHQHFQVENESFPDHFHFISQERIEHLYFIRAFSATLTRNLKKADLFFQKANIGLNMTMSDEISIYKLNLYALFLVIKGDDESAFILENKLYDYLQNHNIHDAAINHVVLINIARLYKKSKQYELASEYYEKAYETLKDCGFTTFYHMNYAIDKAILCEACDQMEEAFYFWMKVAIYWVCCVNIYQLPVRTRLVLCQEKVTDTVLPLLKDKVNRFLLQKLNYFFVITDIQRAKQELPVLHFTIDEPKTIPNTPLEHALHHLLKNHMSNVRAASTQYIPSTNEF